VLPCNSNCNVRQCRNCKREEMGIYITKLEGNRLTWPLPIWRQPSRICIEVPTLLTRLSWKVLCFAILCRIVYCKFTDVSRTDEQTKQRATSNLHFTALLGPLANVSNVGSVTGWWHSVEAGYTIKIISIISGSSGFNDRWKRFLWVNPAMTNGNWDRNTELPRAELSFKMVESVASLHGNYRRE
jgi:hypothetical protein